MMPLDVGDGCGGVDRKLPPKAPDTRYSNRITRIGAWPYADRVELELAHDARLDLVVGSISLAANDRQLRLESFEIRRVEIARAAPDVHESRLALGGPDSKCQSGRRRVAT